MKKMKETGLTMNWRKAGVKESKRGKYEMKKI
jgi:hypothetical protein